MSTDPPFQGSASQAAEPASSTSSLVSSYSSVSSSDAATDAQVYEQFAWISTLPGGAQDHGRAQRQIWDIGACERPIWLRGRSLTIALASGAVVNEFSSADAPFGAVPIRCGNRRAARCGPCSRLYRGDAYQVARSGMTGGKGVPETVADNPQVFVTLTAPSFGAVHRVCSKDDPRNRCRARRGRPVCPHGKALFCAARHEPGDKAIGTPLCADCYDYTQHVLFNALASRLWKGMTDILYHRLASLGGVSRSEIRALVRVEYVKVAEFQARGVVHFHIVIRLDGGQGAGSAPPVWAMAELLCDAVRSAAASVSVAAPSSDAVGDRVLRFGEQIDVQVIGSAESVADRRVSGYLAKYTTKATEDAGGADYPITHASQIEVAGRTEHARALMRTAIRLGTLKEFEGLNLAHWCHMLGYGGHATTKSAHYSVTFGALRQARAAFKAGPVSDVPGGVVVDAEWSYAYSGYPSVSLRLYAEQLREQIENARRLARDALAMERSRPAGVGSPPGDLRAFGRVGGEA